MRKTDTLSSLDRATQALKAARAHRRKADTELARAKVTQGKAIEQENAAEAAYRAARKAVEEAYPEYNAG